MKRFILFILISTSCHCIANISSPEIQQALHTSVSSEDGFSSDHIFTCQDGLVVRCDDNDNVIFLKQFIIDAAQTNVDFSVFTHLERYFASIDTALTQLPDLSTLTSLTEITLLGRNVTFANVDGSRFPANLDNLSIDAPISNLVLNNWAGHHISSLRLSGINVDFNHSVFATLKKLDLSLSQSLSNTNFPAFSQVDTFSWSAMSKSNIPLYQATRIQFPLLSSDTIDIDLTRAYKEPALNEIPAYILAIPNLRSLTIRNHDISEVPAALLSMPSLKYLDLSGNKIQNLPAISANSNIEQLDLSHNQLTLVPEAIWHLNKLQQLNISSNQISQLPANLFSLASLQTIDASFNQVNSITIANPNSALQTLNLRRNQLTTVPALLFQLEHLQTLNLQSNKLQSINISSTSSALQSVDLMDNQLNTVPAMLFQLEQLQTLDLRNNKIQHLPEITASQASLKTLNLSRNKIVSLPVGLFNFLPIQNLLADTNQISQLPDNIVNNTLTNVDFSYNQFTQIPAQLAALTSLDSAIFSHNEITHSTDDWKQSPSIKTLDLSGNKLSELAPLLDNLPSSLIKLDVSKNHLLGKLTAYHKPNPNFSLDISQNALWSTDSGVLQQYASQNSSVLASQLLPARGVKVTEKTVNGVLTSYVQWGFPLMQTSTGTRTAGIHKQPQKPALNPNEINPGPYISSDYRLEIRYNSGKTVKKTFVCFMLWPIFPHACAPKHYSASYNDTNYDSSVFTYAVKGSLKDAQITVYSLGLGIESSPTYLGAVQEHELFVDELKYDQAILPPVPRTGLSIKIGSLAYYQLLALLLIAAIKIAHRRGQFKKLHCAKRSAGSFI